MFILDAHSDLLVDIASRRINGEREVFLNRHMPRLKKGGINAVLSVVWIDPPNDANPLQRMIQIIDNGFADLHNLSGVAFPVTSINDLRSAIDQGKIALILGMEGLEGLENSESLYYLYSLGLRHASLTWNAANSFGTGVRSEMTERGLTDNGKRAVKIIEELGMLLDVSHASEKTFWDIADIATGPIIASHSNAFGVCPADRNLKDDQIKLIKDSGGLIGINSWHEFIDPKPSFDKLAEHVDYIVEKAGIDHVIFGFDFTDFLESESVASFQTTDNVSYDGLTSCERIPDFIACLKNRGYTAEDIEKISYNNFERLFLKIMKSVW